MNMIVCRHPGDSGKFLFRLPEDITMDPNVYVTVETKRGNQPAKTVTPSFHADPDVICPLWGTQPKMMTRVLSWMNESRIPWPEQEEVPFSELPDELPE